MTFKSKVSCCVFGPLVIACLCWGCYTMGVMNERQRSQAESVEAQQPNESRAFKLGYATGRLSKALEVSTIGE